MFRRTLRMFSWLLLLGSLTMMIFLGIESITSQIALASVSQTEDAQGGMLYSSQHKLNDASGNFWHILLFKRVYPGQPVSIHLRLVGCSGAGELLHPQPLRITSSTGKVWKATDIFLDRAPAPTIGQYELRDILPELPTDQLLLSLPLGRDRFINISVPQSLVQEWQEVAARQSLSGELSINFGFPSSTQPKQANQRL